MTVSSWVVASGTFRLWFSNEPSAFTAARDARTRGFVVETARVAMDRWTADARPRSIVPLAELERYASRLKRIATDHDGTYVGFTTD